MTAADLDRESLLTLQEVMARVKMGKSKLYAEINAGRFPAAIKMGTSSRWKVGHVYDWLAKLGKEQEPA